MQPSSPQTVSRTRRLLRYLRVAISVTCGIACVLLAVLWVRTAYVVDSCGGPISNLTYVGVMSRDGGIGLVFYKPTPALDSAVWSYYADTPLLQVPFEYKTALGFVQYLETARAYRVRTPNWSLIVLFGTLGTMPWLRWRFSLRTLLIVTTLVAVVLGLIIYAAR